VQALPSVSRESQVRSSAWKMRAAAAAVYGLADDLAVVATGVGEAEAEAETEAEAEAEAEAARRAGLTSEREAGVG
jgi:hypothetical protein